MIMLGIVLQLAVTLRPSWSSESRFYQNNSIIKKLKSTGWGVMKNTNMPICIYLKASCEMTNALLVSMEGFIVGSQPQNQEMTVVIYNSETLLKIPSFL